MLFSLLTMLALAAPLDAPPLPGEPLGDWHALESSTPGEMLGADAAVARAIANNKGLSARLAEADRARAIRMTARALPNPSAELVLYEDEHAGLSGVDVEYALSGALLTPLRARSAQRSPCSDACMVCARISGRAMTA